MDGKNVCLNEWLVTDISSEQEEVMFVLMEEVHCRSCF